MTDPTDTTLRERFRSPAVVHEWLTTPGGSENVVMEILGMLGDADVYTSIYDPAPWPPIITDRRVHTSFLNRIPGARTQYPKLLPLMNRAFESFDLSGHDLVISSSHSCAKNVLTEPETLHVCYCHTPMRHAWEPHMLEGELSGPAGLAARALLPKLRRDDFAAAGRPDLYVANSHYVAARIRKYYRRDAQVIHPPVDVARHLGRPRRDDGYYLVLGRLVPYKRGDLALAACAQLGRPVKVIGSGRALAAAQAVAGPGAEFLGRVDDEEMDRVLSGARALLFPGEEDFGIVPAEAQAAGVPVIAYGAGGALESVVAGETGVFHAEQTVASVVSAMLEFEQMTFREDVIRANARRFAPERFRSELRTAILDLAQERS